ncbi:MAG: Mfa1 family fimbria major subunit [Bacteroides sp.]|nr:Mfa1 family fimbria major subunit [Bacteroides sp.]
MKSNKLFYSLVLAFALTGCINDEDVTVTDGSTDSSTSVSNLRVAFAVPNTSNGTRATAEDSGEYEEGTADEYRVNNVTLYLFDSDSKNLETTISIASTDLGAAVSDGTNITYSCDKEIILDPGTYDILAIANSTGTLSVGSESTLLGQIDATTYGTGLISSIPDNGFVMTNRGSANQSVTVEAVEAGGTATSATIRLERTIAKLMLRNAANEYYTLTNTAGETYATVRLNNYKFVNLANKFYTFRHVATLSDAEETPSAPSSYTIDGGNFGNIADVNGYLIDPYFFDKTVAGATTSFSGGTFYTNHLSQQGDSDWSGLATAGTYVAAYCLENCMFRPAQNTVYTTGIMLKGTLTPSYSQTINGSTGEALTSEAEVLTYNTLYYFNYKFYTSLAGVGEYGDANIDGLTVNSTDDELAAKQILRFTKSGGNFSTFYNYWIKHLDNNDAASMGVMEFGIVRNNIYSVNITSISSLGPGTPEIGPNPDENKGYLNVEFGVYPWIVRDQNADL